MTSNRFQLAGIEAGNPTEPSCEFIQSFQTALLLSLLNRGLLTQWQFDRCIEEIKNKDISK